VAKERGGAHQKASLWWRGSAAGKRRRQARVGDTARGLSGRGGCTRRRGAWGGVKTVRGWLEQAVRGGSIQSERNGGGGAEEQPRARGKEVVGSSRRQCRARGGDEEFGGGPEWRFTVAQQRQHDGAVAATGGGGKGQLTGRGAPFKGRTRRWLRAAEMVAGTAGGSGR
jgi:hypothetical protein